MSISYSYLYFEALNSTYCIVPVRGSENEVSQAQRMHQSSERIANRLI